MTKYILAMCPKEGPERFVPNLETRYGSHAAAIAQGSKALLQEKSPYQSFQVWTIGETYTLEPRVVKATDQPVRAAA